MYSAPMLPAATAAALSVRTLPAMARTPRPLDIDARTGFVSWATTMPERTAEDDRETVPARGQS